MIKIKKKSQKPILQITFTDCAKFMARSLSNPANNLAEGIHKINKHDNKKCKTYRIQYKNCERFLEYKNFKDDLIEHQCL